MGFDAEYSSVPNTVTSKAAFYDHVLHSLQGLLAVQNGQKHNWISALSSVASVLFNAYADFPLGFGESRRVNWAGFYLIPDLYTAASRGTGERNIRGVPEFLLLGPYNGRPGCLEIPLTRPRKGVCAQAFLSGRTVTVQNVHREPGHIACDASTEAEIVFPLILGVDKTHEGTPSSPVSVLGVLDIDCQRKDSWDLADEHGLQRIVGWLMQEDGVIDWGM